MEKFLNDFRHTIENGKNELLLISDDEAGADKPGKWSPKQIIGHLIDSAANNHQRFVRAQFTDDLVCPGYEQDAWVTVQRYNEEPWPQLVELWAAYNRHIAHVISAMDHDVLERERKEHNLDQIAFRTVEQSSPTTLEYFVRDYVDHLRHHLQQILREEAATG